MIPVDRQEELVQRVASEVVHQDYPTSYNVVVPPGFGEEALAAAIEKALRESGQSPLIANLAVDRIASPAAYVAELHHQWSQQTALGPLPRDGSPSIRLQRLVQLLPPGRPAVQLVRRFHKFLDALDQFILGTMRDLESGHRLRSINFSPFFYRELKRRWEQRGAKLVSSNYGDVHSEQAVAPLDHDKAVQHCRAAGMPERMSHFVVELTGGYPEVSQDLIATWIRRGRPDWTTPLGTELRELACRRMRNLVDDLDDPGRTDTRDAVVSLHTDLGSEEDRALLERHPWGPILLDDEGLRAEAVGLAAVEAVSEEWKHGAGGAGWLRAREYYLRGKYRAAHELIAALEAGARLEATPAQLLLRAHSDVMAHLVHDESGAEGIDGDWQRARQAIKRAREVVGRIVQRMDATDVSRLASRYDELDELAAAIVDVQRTGARRVVDVLAGCSGASSQANARACLVLLLLAIRDASSERRHSRACQAALALPEQVFRIWARWRLELDQSQQPSDAEATWADVVAGWPGAHIEPCPGSPFDSFDSFARFALASALRRKLPAVLLPERTIGELGSALGLLQVRRDHAHAVSHNSQATRQKLFALIQRWFECLLPACTAHAEHWSYEALLDQLRPLPLLDESGAVMWIG